MSVLQGRSRTTRLFLRRMGLVALLVVLVVAIFGVWGAYQKEQESAVLRERRERERDELLARKNQVSIDLEKMQTDRGKEEVLRAQYALAEAGEGLIVIVEPATTTPITATTTVIEKIRKFFWPW